MKLKLNWMIVALSLSLMIIGLLLSIVARVESNGELSLAPHQFFNPIETITFSLIGALIASKHQKNP